ncbi:MAG: preprotein translocase subunit SecE [Candidatus Margulisbacteria bacterium]|nr:preprotein translocase subunit SecE [Candidatus Margulisiibacteriota bacterium]
MNEIVEKKGPFNFIKQTQAEMKKVTWPTRTEVTSATLIILFILIVLGFMIGFLDVFLAQVIKFLIKVF